MDLCTAGVVLVLEDLVGEHLPDDHFLGLGSVAGHFSKHCCFACARLGTDQSI